MQGRPRVSKQVRRGPYYRARVADVVQAASGFEQFDGREPNHGTGRVQGGYTDPVGLNDASQSSAVPTQ